jgi:HAE1 family hydrophobic/amphiphilic exporter-1
MLGITVLGGMLAASLIAIFLIPVTFYVVEKLSHRHDQPQPDAPPPGSPQATGDGHRPQAVPRPEPLPAHARLEGEH